MNDEAKRWVETTLAGLSIREKLGQVMIPRLTPNALRAFGGSVRRYIEEQMPGGVHLFGGNPEETRRMLAEAQEASAIPLLVTGDLERGAGQRVEGGTEFSGQLALGACGDERLAYRFGEAIAVEGRAAGFNWVFGPVLDLSANPSNLSHIRCLGADPKTVARLGAQIIRGIQDHGMAATGKHLPGGGLEDLDSHLTTPVNRASRAAWLRGSGVPFKAAIDAGVWTLMASPIACPAMDPECGDPRFPRPVMTSRAFCTDWIRKRWGFEGVLVTDALTMGGLTMHFRRLEMHLACLNAGNDMLLFVHRLDSVYAYLEQCLADGRLALQRLDEAVRRVLTLKTRIGLHRQPGLMSDAERKRIMSGSTYAADAERLAARSLTLVRDRRRVVPLPDRPGLRVCSVLITNRPEFNLDVFEGALRDAGCRVDAVRNPPAESLYDRIERGEWDALVVSLYYPPQWGWSTGRCHGPESRCLMDGFPFANPATPPVFISWANPYHLYEFAFMDPYINTYGGCPGTQRAAALALLGRAGFAGRSPVALPPFFKIGDGISRRSRRAPRSGAVS